MSRREGSALPVATAGATPRCSRRLTDLCASAREIGRGDVAVGETKKRKKIYFMVTVQQWGEYNLGEI